MMEKPIYPSPYMRITQQHNVGTHIDSFAIDEAGMDGGIDYILAPFTGIIKKIYTKDANEVWLESLDKVEYPDGTIDYMTVMFAHANDVSNLFIGKKLIKKQSFILKVQKEMLQETIAILNVAKENLLEQVGMLIQKVIG